MFLWYNILRGDSEMTKPIIFIQGNYRAEFIEKIKASATEYRVKTTLIDEDLEFVEISVGWDKKNEQQLLAHSPLKWVQAISAGVDYLPLKEFEKKGILLTNASGLHSISISEHVIGVILSYYRGLNTAQKNQLAHTWNTDDIHYDQLSGKNMLVIGTGHIGEKLAKSVVSLGVNPFGINTTGHTVDGFIETYSMKNLAKIIQTMDIVVGILPGTDDTFHIFNNDLFSQMKPSAIFINVGRGDTVHTRELTETLQNKTIAFAALDVFEAEPLPADSPLWELDNLLITPHISGLTKHFQTKLMQIFLPNLTSFVKDGSLAKNQVSLKKGY